MANQGSPFVKIDCKKLTLDELLNKTEEELVQEWKKIRTMNIKKIQDFTKFKITFIESGKHLAKHRYGNLLCIDRTRFVLDDGGFINANTVRMEDQTFLATQGPMDETEADFWSMMWQSDSKSIIMLCSTTEEGSQKCHQYWPIKEPKLVDETFNITVQERKKLFGHSGITTTTLLLQNVLTNESKVVTHYNVSTWPDHLAPATNSDLLFIYKAVINVQHALTVHCSAGVGRTGVFIAAYCCYEIFSKNKKLSIYDALLKIRSQRHNCVQNFIQYLHLHLLFIELVQQSNGYPEFKSLLQDLKQKYDQLLKGQIKKQLDHQKAKPARKNK